MATATLEAPNTMPVGDDDAADVRYRVTVQQYVAYRRRGFLVVPGLVSPEDIDELRRHTEDLMQGKLSEQEAAVLDAPPANLSAEEKAQHFLRIHMLHRKLELHERYMLHPRVLDVLEVLAGPDVLAMQTMLFLKPPGKPGQGWHQDSYYIPTHPDTLIGAWIAIDDCDEQNGGMWMAAGSHVEPIYPAPNHGNGDWKLGDIAHVNGVSNIDDDANDLSPIAARYDQVMVSAKAGDVVFFHSHILHRSKANFTTDRFRRSFVSHYCNARSFTQWGADWPSTDPHSSPVVDPVTKMTNGSHILARGDTHLPFAGPRFGTPCAALLTPEARTSRRDYAVAATADMNSGLMDMTPADPAVAHDDIKAAANGYVGY